MAGNRRSRAPRARPSTAIKPPVASPKRDRNSGLGQITDHDTRPFSPRFQFLESPLQVELIAVLLLLLSGLILANRWDDGEY